MVHCHTVHLPLGALLSPCTVCGTGERVRRDVESLLYAAQADLVLTGHVHAYERTHPIFDSKVDPCGPVHLLLGDGYCLLLSVTACYCLFHTSDELLAVERQPRPHAHGADRRAHRRLEVAHLGLVERSLCECVCVCYGYQHS